VLDSAIANTIYTQLNRHRATDPVMEPLITDLWRCCLRYAAIRAGWPLMTAEERHGADPGRTAAHNVVIDACNILSREMGKRGMDASWREKLGQDRRVIGDFACHVHCFMGLQSR
jgi:hypothetical protein